MAFRQGDTARSEPNRGTPSTPTSTGRSTSRTSTIPTQAEVARLDLGSVLIPVPEAGQLQVELNPAGRAERGLGDHAQRPVHHRGVCRTQDRRAVARGRHRAGRFAAQGLGARSRIEDGPWGREVVGVAAMDQRRRDALHRGRRLPLDGPLRGQRGGRDCRCDGRPRRETRWPTPWFVVATRRCRCAPRSRWNCPRRWRRSCGRRAAAGRRPRARSAASSRSRREPSRAPRSAPGSAMQQLRTTMGGGLARASASCSAATQAAPSTAGSAPISSSVTVRSAARARRPPIPSATSTGCIGSSDRRGDAHRNASAAPAPRTVGADVAGRLLHRVGQCGPLAHPRPGQLVGEPRRAGRAHLRGRRRQPVAAQH